VRTVQENIEREFVVATEADVDSAGAQTYWSLGGEANRDQLVAEATVRGISIMPRLVEPETAIGRAVACLKGKRRIVRSIRKGKFAVVEEELDVSRDKLKHWEGPTIELDKVGRPIFEGATTEEAQQVRDAYAQALDALDTNDISQWLLTGLERMNAVGLRKTGGIYYVPPAFMPSWRKFAEVLKIVAPACTVYFIPTVRMTADGARAILDSLTFEVEEAANKLTEKVVSGELGVRGLDNRAADSAALLAKVSQYEMLVGSRLEKLRNVINKLDLDVAAAKLACEAMEDDAS
jgi:hypothetical protein